MLALESFTLNTPIRFTHALIDRKENFRLTFLGYSKKTAIWKMVLVHRSHTESSFFTDPIWCREFRYTKSLNIHTPINFF